MNEPTRANRLLGLASCLISFGILGALVGLSGCLVGPNYKGPPEAASDSVAQGKFHRANMVQGSSGLVQQRWWVTLEDPILNRLIDDALTSSPRLKVALARVRSARAQMQLEGTKLLPTGGADVAYTRARIPTGSILDGSTAGNAIPNPIDAGIYSAGFDASWELDLFGGIRRGVESAKAAADAQQATYDDVKVQLTSEIAKAYVQLREAQRRLDLMNRSLEVSSQAVALTEQRRALGTATEGEVQQLRNRSSQSRAELPELRFTVDRQFDQIAILTGREPGALDTELSSDQADTKMQPMPPDAVPITDPYQWLRHRPDIREAERKLASSNAMIGQHVADYFPKVQLLGLVGYSGASPSRLVHGSPASIGLPSLYWNFLGYPNTRAKVRGAEADRDAAGADYERTVLEALQDANDSLSRFGHQREAVLERRTVLAGSTRMAMLAEQRRARGTATQIDVLDANRTALSDEDQLIQASSKLVQAYISLQKGLGLGWDEAQTSQTGDPHPHRFTFW